MNELRQTFKPEFINRIDEIIIFKSLDKNVIYEILDKIIKDIEKRLSDKQLKIVLTDKAKNYIVENSYDSRYGARPIKRFVTKTVENLIANEIINNEVKFNSTITIDVNQDLYIQKID